MGTGGRITRTRKRGSRPRSRAYHNRFRGATMASASPTPQASQRVRTCAIPGCDWGKPLYAGGICSTHNYRRKHGLPMDAPIGSLPTGRSKPPRFCSEGGCEAVHHSRDLCRRHYERMLMAAPGRRARVNRRTRRRSRERWASDPGFRARRVAVRRNRRRTYGSSKRRRQLPALICAQDGLCGICGNPLPADLTVIEVDHVIPVARGGLDTLDNLQAAHTACNRAKGARCPFTT